jgi:hypothetical protein
LFRDLELHRAVGFLLHDDRSGSHPIALRHIANLQPEEITASQLAVDGQVEKRKVPNSIGQLKADPDPPNLFQLEWELLADQFVLVPGGMAIFIVECLIHGRLLTKFEEGTRFP